AAAQAPASSRHALKTGVSAVVVTGLIAGAFALLRSVHEEPIPSFRQLDNVGAFARLYGAVRYFYPSDAAASLDWDRFAVHGVNHVRMAPDATGLQAALTALFKPLGPGIAIDTVLPAPAPVGSP